MGWQLTWLSFWGRFELLPTWRSRGSFSNPPPRTSRANTNVTEAVLPCVGVLPGTIQVVYNNTAIVLLKGSWVPPNTNGEREHQEGRLWILDGRLQATSTRKIIQPEIVSCACQTSGFLPRRPTGAGREGSLTEKRAEVVVRVVNHSDSILVGAGATNGELKADMNIGRARYEYDENLDGAMEVH